MFNIDIARELYFKNKAKYKQGYAFLKTAQELKISVAELSRLWKKYK